MVHSSRREPFYMAGLDFDVELVDHLLERLHLRGKGQVLVYKGVDRSVDDFHGLRGALHPARAALFRKSAAVFPTTPLTRRAY